MIQEVLARHLEEQGIVEKGAFSNALKERLSKLSPARRDDPMLGPLKILMKALDDPAFLPRRKH